MSNGVQMMVAVFESEAAADGAYNQIKRNANNPWLDDVAIVVHHGSKVKIKESKDMRGGKGAIVAVVSENLVSQAADALKRLGATVTTPGLEADTVSRLKAAHEADVTGAA
jgi:ATP phosphoribosyltransferase